MKRRPCLSGIRVVSVIGVLAGLALGVPEGRAESGFIMTAGLYQSIDLNTSMSVYDPHILLVTFGEPADLERLLEPDDFTFSLLPDTDLAFSIDPAADSILALVSPDTPVIFLEGTPYETVTTDMLEALSPMSGSDRFVVTASDVLALYRDDRWVLVSDAQWVPEELAVRFISTSPENIPEPASVFLVGSGMLALLTTLIRRRV